MKKALVILHPGFEEIEALTPVDLLTRAGIEVIQASTTDNTQVEGRSGITVEATHALATVANDDFDAVILPGGPGIFKLRNNPTICALLQRQHAAGRLIGCICAAPLLLKDAEMTNALRYTCHPSAEDELPAAIADPVVKDGSIITSRGAGTATQFALALVTHLTDAANTQAIAKSICWTQRA